MSEVFFHHSLTHLLACLVSGYATHSCYLNGCASKRSAADEVKDEIIWTLITVLCGNFQLCATPSVALCIVGRHCSPHIKTMGQPQQLFYRWSCVWAPCVSLNLGNNDAEWQILPVILGVILFHILWFNTFTLCLVKVLLFLMSFQACEDIAWEENTGQIMSWIDSVGDSNLFFNKEQSCIIQDGWQPLETL